MLCSFKYLLFYIYLFINIKLLECKMEFRRPSTLNSDQLSFMKRYGYLPNEPENEIGFVYTPHSISEALIRLQHFAGLPQTGQLDAQTKQLFVSRRCGNKDIDESPYRRKRYLLHQPWEKKVITYSVKNGTRTLSKERVELLMEKGLGMWAKHGNLTFVKVDNVKADIEVTFTTGSHGDGSPFDGEGGVVAHAFPPPFGSIHFDDDELWGEDVNDNDDVTDFLSAAIHEIGHALGLKHSNVKSAVMYPYYQSQIRDVQDDDIQGMRELYLKDSPFAPMAITVSTTVPPATPKTSLVPRFTKTDYDDDDMPQLCYTNYDTIQVINGNICIFEEEWMWMLTNKKELVPGYPKRFHDVFKGLPSHVISIKAIYVNRRGNVVIFSGRKFWEFDGNFKLKYTGNIKKFKIPKYVDEMTTVFLSNYNNKTYFMAYERFWRYDERKGKLDAGYPKSMAAWRNVSYPVDAAIIWEGDTYFFRGPRFWRFDNTLVAAQEYYPAPTAQIWFPCPDDDKMDGYFLNED